LVGIDTAGEGRSADERQRAASIAPHEHLALAFFDAVRDVVLFCRDEAGKPIGYPMRTVACEPGALIYTTYRKSAKVRHLERDPRVCVLATRWDGGVLRWQSVEGRARVIVPSHEEIDRVMGTPHRSGGRGTEPRVPDGMGDFVKLRLREGKRVFVCVEDIVAAQPVARAGARFRG
jgi:hypothetical protein